MYPSNHTVSHWLHPYEVLYTTSFRFLLSLILDRESNIHSLIHSPHISGECTDHSAVTYLRPCLSLYFQPEILSQKINFLGKSQTCANHSLSVLKVMRVRKYPVLQHLSSLYKGFSVVQDGPQLQKRQQIVAFFPKHWIFSHGKLLQLKVYVFYAFYAFSSTSFPMDSCWGM